MFEITYQGTAMKFANALWTDFEMVESHTLSENVHQAKIILHNNKSLNNLLEAVLSEVQIMEVKELIPSMREIFIESVNNHK